MASTRKSERSSSRKPSRKPKRAESDPAVPAPASPRGSFPIVGIGASAGGLAAFESFFSAMPTDAPTGMAFVLVQHLAPDHKSILSELVRRYTRMEVLEVEDGMQVRPDCAYIIPPNRDMAFLDGALHLFEPASPRGMRLPIDFFFRSLAQDQRERAICVVLSGTGSDGSLGVRAVKGEGGMAIAQDPATTEYDGMPRSAIATGLVDFVLPPATMAGQIVAYVGRAFGPPRSASPPIAHAEELLKKIAILLRAQTGHDFSQYKETSIVRRVERRMALHQLDTQQEYLRYLQQTPAEVDALFQDLLIGVTSFFRDREVFEALEAKAIPRLFAGRPSGAPIRAWVCGCSTGEEAYSLAILIQEHLDTLKQTHRVQIFATDIDGRAIEHARGGVYPASVASDLSAERLARYFAPAGEGHYRVQKVVRDLLVFSEQDVIKDPPFSRLDLVSCRNLLIYLNADLHRRLIPLFHYALNPAGILLLGSSETVGEHDTLFEGLDRKSKIYLRREDHLVGRRLPPGTVSPVELPVPAERGAVWVDRRPNLRELTERALLRHWSPAALLVNGRGEILHIVGRTGKFLEPAPGDTVVNILPMAREGLRRELTMALHKAVASQEPIVSRGLRVKADGGQIGAGLTVRPVPPEVAGEPQPDLYLVVLEETPPPVAEPDEAHGPRPIEAEARIAALERELQAKEEYLQTTLEEMETANEELRSTNEEMQSGNEELQSTNEELETSKEELQSVNEELATVNLELQTKVADLSRLNNDMNNLLAGTGVGTLFVDHRLRIARFTPSTTELINLIESDVGRPVAHIVSNLVGYDRLVEDVQAVLRDLIPREVEVQTRSGNWFLMGIRPYRTLENVIEGAVITFVNITRTRNAEAARRRSEEQLRLALESARGDQKRGT